MKKFSLIKISSILFGLLALVATSFTFSNETIEKTSAGTFTEIPENGSLVNSGKYLQNFGVVQTEFKSLGTKPPDIVEDYFDQDEDQCFNRIVRDPRENDKPFAAGVDFHLNYVDWVTDRNDLVLLFHTGTDDRNLAVTDLFGVYVDTPSGDTHQPDHYITRKVNGFDVKYEAISCFNYTDVDNPVFYPEADLNAGAGGWTITLYCTTDPHAGMPLKDVRILMSKYKLNEVTYPEEEFRNWEMAKARVWWDTDPAHETIFDYDIGVKSIYSFNYLLLRRYDDDLLTTKVLFDGSEVGTVKHGGYIVPSEVTINQVFTGYNSTNSEVVLFSNYKYSDETRITAENIVYQDNVIAVVRSKSTSPEDEILFLYKTYMHFEGDGSYNKYQSGNGDCISKGWYREIKRAMNYIIHEDTWEYYINGGTTNEYYYYEVIDRLSAWANANGEEFVIDTDTNTVSFKANGASSNLIVNNVINESIIIVLFTVLTVLFFALLLLRKRKYSKNNK